MTQPTDTNGKSETEITKQPELLSTFRDEELKAIMQRNLAYRDAAMKDPARDLFEVVGGVAFGGLYDKDLAGVPFLAVGMPVFKTRTGNFGPQETAELYIQRIDMDGGIVGLPEIARFSGRYVVNKLKYLAQKELVGHVVWTLGRNPNWPLIATTKQHPLGLRPYMYGTDRPEIVDSDQEHYQHGAEFPTERITAGTPQARVEQAIAELQEAGGPVPPWAVEEEVVNAQETPEIGETVRRGPGRPPNPKR
jgi:hypothetical protein